MTTSIRAMHPNDVGFVWETSMKVRQPRDLPWSVWLEEAGAAFREALGREGTTIHVLGFDDVIVGFSWWQGAVLRMVYVKRDLRGFGYGLQLVREHEAGQVAVHKPNWCWRRWALRAGVPWREI